jgi:hypothetical protein
VAHAEEGTVRLNNGSVLRGEIVVYVPGVRVSIRAADGEVYTFQASEIAQVQIDGQAAPAQGQQQPQDPVQTPEGYQVPVVDSSGSGQEVDPNTGAPTAQQPSPQAPPPPQAVGVTGTAPGYGAPQVGRRQQLMTERENLVRERPGIGSPIVFMGLGAAVGVVGGAFWAVSSQNDPERPEEFFGNGCSESFVFECSWSSGMILGVVFMVAGPVLFIVNTIRMISRLGKRSRVNRRIREIDAELANTQANGPELRWDVDLSANRARLLLTGRF